MRSQRLWHVKLVFSSGFQVLKVKKIWDTNLWICMHKDVVLPGPVYYCYVASASNSSEEGCPLLKTGGCHCGAVKFEVEFAENPVVSECNCSICRATGYLHLIVPAEKFHLVSGREYLTTYTFGTGVAQHHFCKICGVKSFYVPRSNPHGFSVNLRCLDDAENLAYSIKPFDGQNWEAHAAELKHHSE